MTEILTRYPINSPKIIESKEILPFSPCDYSNFKFGRTDIAEQYAKDLLRYFISKFMDKFKFKDLIIYPSPYFTIPTASYYIATYFFNHLKNISAPLEISSCRIGKINRYHTYTDDYGNLSFSERYNLIKKGSYKFETHPDRNSLLVFIDDISITGAHQLVLEQLLKDYVVENDVMFLYYAKLSNQQISPQIENTLNYFKIKSFEDLIVLCNHPSFNLTTRFVKYILSINPTELAVFISSLKNLQMHKVLLSIVVAAEANQYQCIDKYVNNFNLLNKSVSSFNRNINFT